MYNILVCDDDREIVDAIEIYLTQEGYHVLKAYDGMQAIQMLEREEIQLLIIDVMLSLIHISEPTRLGDVYKRQLSTS